jgi:hypothetical protein
MIKEGLQERGPLGWGLAFMRVLETQMRITLHGHASMWTDISPYTLQCCAFIKPLMAMIGKMLDSMLTTKIPASIHMIQMLHMVTKRRQPEAVNMKSCSPFTDERGFNLKLHLTQATTAVHKHYQLTCQSSRGNFPTCRFGKGSPLCEKTCARQLVESKDSVNGYEVLEEIRPLNARYHDTDRNFMIHPLVPLDDRCIVLSTSRPAIGKAELDLCHLPSLPENDSAACMTQFFNDLFKSFETVDYPALSDVSKAAFRKITFEQLQLIYKVLETRNRAVLDIVPMMAVVLGCNTCMYALGSAEQCLAVFFYLVKYITKDASPLMTCLPLVRIV